MNAAGPVGEQWRHWYLLKTLEHGLGNHVAGSRRAANLNVTPVIEALLPSTTSWHLDLVFLRTFSSEFVVLQKVSDDVTLPVQEVNRRQ